MLCYLLNLKSMISDIFALFFGILVLIKLYLVYRKGKCENNVCLSGKTIIVTGANTGIGYEAAKEFSKRGAKVILACRNGEKAERAAQTIIKSTQNEKVTFKLVDFACLESVRKFSKDILEEEEKIDVLVNNAGAAGMRHKTTGDGLQILMQINYFAPFLMTILLLDILKQTPGSRVINVSSLLAKQGKVGATFLNKFRGLYQTYSNSKLCNILFTQYLARKVLKGTSVSVFSLHPGVINTDIFRRFHGIRKRIFDAIAYFYFKTPIEGAQTIIYAATEPNLEAYTGCHFEDCQVVEDYESAKDFRLAEEIWKGTCDILKIKNTF